MTPYPQAFGLIIIKKKTKLLYQPAPGKPYTEPTRFVNVQKLSAFKKLFALKVPYMSCAVHLDDAVNIWMRPVHLALHKRVSNKLRRLT